MIDKRPWLKNYPLGVPANIDPSQYPTLVSFLKECFRKYKELNAFECIEKKLTYKEVNQYSE